MKLRSGKTYGPPAPKVKITKKVRVKPMKDTTKAQVTSLVKRIVNRNTENKQVGNRIEVAVAHNSAMATADCLSVLPQISQGASAYERLGDKIMPKSLRVQGVVSLDDTQPDERDLYVRICILAQKNIKVGAVINGGAVDVSHMLEPAIAGTAEEIQYTGTTSNITDPINTELFRVYYDRTFKLCPSANQTRTAPLDRQSFKWSYKFKSLPASLTFDDGMRTGSTTLPHSLQ